MPIGPSVPDPWGCEILNFPCERQLNYMTTCLALPCRHWKATKRQDVWTLEIWTTYKHDNSTRTTQNEHEWKKQYCLYHRTDQVNCYIKRQPENCQMLKRKQQLELHGEFDWRPQASSEKKFPFQRRFDKQYWCKHAITISRRNTNKTIPKYNLAHQ
jgi:hypothetical protein